MIIRKKNYRYVQVYNYQSNKIEAKGDKKELNNDINIDDFFFSLHFGTNEIKLLLLSIFVANSTSY